METGLIGLYWRARRASLDECADRCFRSLTSLQTHGYTSFFLKGRSRKQALARPFEVSLSNVRELLEKGVNRDDTDRKPIPELGFSLALWSGGSDGETYAVSMHCGCYSPWVGNNFIVNLPGTGPFSLASSLPAALASFRQLIDIWQPDQGVVCDSSEIRWENQQLSESMKAYSRYPEDPT